MEVITVITGMLDENCYVLINGDEALIVDPGDDINRIKEALGDKKLLAILITHSHFDHIGALRGFLTKKNMKIFKKSNLEEKEYEIGSFKFNCLYTPGHSKDSVTFYFKDENMMFVGDFIFKNSVGRCDLPGGDSNEMQQSLNKMKEYPDDIVLYPGHRDMTTLGNERLYNPYFK